VAAARALAEVDGGAHVEDVLARVAPAEARDRALAWFLALGVLRHRGQVDAALRSVLTRPIGSLDPAVRAAVRLGVFEKLFGRAAPHAVVHQAVEVAKATGAGRAKGLVNAVVRRARAEPNLAPHEALDHPAWIVARWTERYGAAATAAWCAANREPAPLVIVAPDPEAVAAQLRDAGQPTAPVRLGVRELPGALRLEAPEGAVTDLPGFAEGAFWVQDPAAIAVADLVGAKPGMRVLDACAAPGGKTLRLLTAGAEVVAVDSKGPRLQRLRAALERMGLTATLRHHDWREGPLPDAGAPFDAVLVDAPCTGLGTLRRHPEIRWRRQLTDLVSVPPVQAAILSAASEHVRPGGVLVYAVCSPEPEEGRAIVDAFLATHPSFREIEQLHTAPPVDGEDAHAAVRMVRAG
jgi:16S rRNA (cytosine967-C5)-methyltransferase